MSGEFGSLPERVYICAARYQNPNGGTLQGQAPQAVIQNGNIEPNEWATLQLQPDSLTIRADESSVTLRWSAVLGAQNYIIFRSEASNDNMQEIGSTSTTSFMEPANLDRAFYEVRAEH